MRASFKKAYVRFARLSLILVYLVILAGAVVRMTGSGMGCPDWPKCFGYYIPPTEEAELIYAPGRAYRKGQVIIHSESLLLAKADFTAGADFNPADWTPYTRHDYAVFNAAHTWTEYINRLMGALSGLAVLAMAVCSLAWWRERKSRVLAAWLAVLGIGFQAWLGATVVYSVLAPVRITLHMVMALLIVALLAWIVFENARPDPNHKADRPTYRIWSVTVVLSLMQIALGTQVRQFVDRQAEALGELSRDLWLDAPTALFYAHRSFSIVLVLLHLWVANRVYRYGLGYRKMTAALASIFLILASGVAMNYWGFPWGSQPVHLVMASLLFGLQWYLLLEMHRARVAGKSS